MEEHKDLIQENKSSLTELSVTEDSLKEIKKRFSCKTKIYPQTEWWDWDS